MSDVVWLQTPTALINMTNVDVIGFATKKDNVEINIFFVGQTSEPVPIAYLKSHKAAMRFMKIVSELLKTGKKFIDATLIADQCNSSPESDV